MSHARRLTQGHPTRTAKMRPAFTTLHARTLAPDTTPHTLTNALDHAATTVTDRWRTSEGMVWATALRRYAMLTNGDTYTRPAPTTPTTNTPQIGDTATITHPDGTTHTGQVITNRPGTPPDHTTIRVVPGTNGARYDLHTAPTTNIT